MLTRERVRYMVDLVRIIVAAFAGAYFKLRFKPLALSYRGAKTLLVGNGPGARHDLSRIQKDSYDVVAGVNGMATSDVFDLLRPNVYFLQDSYWFDDSPQTESKRAKTKSGLSNAGWEINLYFPKKYENSNFILDMAKNENIKLFPMGQYSFQNLGTGILEPEFFRTLAPRNLRLVFWLWNKSLATTLGTGIASNALFELVKSGAASVDIVGVDMSMANDLKVDADGKVSFTPTHFYEPTDDKVSLTHDITMASAYLSISQKFLTFQILAEYASANNCEVAIHSKTSFLDTFPRVNKPM